MQTHRNEESTSSSFSKNIVKNEETISTYVVKRENVPTEEMCRLASSRGKRPSTDSQREMTTPHMKRIKQEDKSCFWEDKESILLSGKTSLQTIVSEVAHSFENNSDIYESISTSHRGKDNVKRTFATEKGTVGFQHIGREPKRSPEIVEDINEVATERESHEVSMPPDNKGKTEISVLSIADQVQAETTKPILRTIKSSDSGKSDGFAYDHNFFPKLVGVHSISSPLSSSTETDFQRKTQCSPPVLEKPCQRQNVNDHVEAGEAVNVYEVKPCASSRANQIPRDSRSQSPSNYQSEKERDLLFTFKQDDGKNDMFLVIKDEVFSVKRFDHKGESYLVHTDNKGKTSILAKVPKEGKSGSQGGGSKSEAIGQRVSNNRTRYANVSTIVSQLSRQTSLQRTTPHQPAPSPISSQIPQGIYARIADINAEETAPATCGQQQVAYDDTRMLRRLLSNVEQRGESSGSRPVLPAGQQRFLSQARTDRHPVISNDSLQNSTAVVAHSQASAVLNTSLSNQHMIANHALPAKNQPIYNAANQFSQHRHTNIPGQSPYSRYNAVSSGKQRYHRHSQEAIEVDNYSKPTFAGLSSRNSSETNENRIEQRKELMRYITHQLASSGNQVPSASNSSELVNLVSKGREAGRHTFSENVTKGSGSSSSRYQEMTGLRQHQDKGASLPTRDAEGHSTSSRSVCSGEGTTTGVFNVGEQYHPLQRVGQTSGDLHSQPQSDVPHLNVHNLQEGLQSKSETEGNSKVLQIIESWKRRQQPFSSSNTFRQLRELLTRVDGSVDSSRNTYSSRREGTLNKQSQVSHPSTVASATPVISQISYGVISRSRDGENITPKRSATALVIDQQHSIYVDATDSVIDERKRPGNTGQQFSSTVNTVSGRSYQLGNAITSFPVSDSSVSGLLQETGRLVNSNINSGQQQNFSSKLPENPAAFSDQRFYNFEMLPRKTAPKVDKRCVANNTLSPVNSRIIPAQIIRLPQERSFVTSFDSSQPSCFNKAPVQSNPNIASPSEVSKPCKVPSSGLSDDTGPSEVAKLCQFVRPCTAATGNGKTGIVDVVEIIDSPPARHSLSSPPTDCENNDEDSYKIDSGQRSRINEEPSSSTVQDTKLCHVDKNETNDVVEITSSRLKGYSIDYVTENKINSNSQSEEDEQIRINALRAELMRKIQNTNDRIAQENIDWKKKYLNRLKIALIKKLAKLPGVFDVTVIDDD